MAVGEQVSVRGVMTPAVQDPLRRARGMTLCGEGLRVTPVAQAPSPATTRESGSVATLNKSDPWFPLSRSLMAALCNTPGITPRAVLVWLALRSHANGSDEAWPSRATLERETGLPRTGVYIALRDLERIGLIETVKDQNGRVPVRRVLDPQTRFTSEPGSPTNRVDEDEEQRQEATPRAEPGSHTNPVHTRTRFTHEPGPGSPANREQNQGTDSSTTPPTRAREGTYADPVTPQVRELCKLASTGEPLAGAADALDKAVHEAQQGGATDADLRVSAIEYLSYCESQGRVPDHHGLNRAILKAKDEAWRLKQRNGKQRVSRQIPTTHTEHADWAEAVESGTLKSRWRIAGESVPSDEQAGTSAALAT